MCNFDDLPVISVYSLEQALDDGVLVKVGECGKTPVVFTRNLLYSGFEDKDKRVELVNRGFSMLRQSDPEDTEYMRLRVIEKDRIWVIQDGNAITFMKPKDY